MPESAAHDHALRAADLTALGRWDAAQSLALTAIALHLTGPEPSPISTGDDSGLDLPPGVTVKPISWTVTPISGTPTSGAPTSVAPTSGTPRRRPPTTWPPTSGAPTSVAPTSGTPGSMPFTQWPDSYTPVGVVTP